VAYPPSEQSLRLQTTDGVSLEAMQVRPAEPCGTLVACHPHPLMGGTMNSKVVHTLYLAFRDQGFRALRFNFRGAGSSGGSHDGGRAERLDVAAAWQHIHDEGHDPSGDGIRVLGGYSFGSFVGLGFAADRADCSHRIGIAPPLSFDYDYSFLLDAEDRRPLYLVAGDDDPHCPLDLVEKLVTQLRAREVPVEATVIAGGNHMFDRKGVVLRQELSRIAAQISGRPWGPPKHPVQRL